VSEGIRSKEDQLFQRNRAMLHIFKEIMLTQIKSLSVTDVIRDYTFYMFVIVTLSGLK